MQEGVPTNISNYYSVVWFFNTQDFFILKGDLPGTPKDMGPLYGTRFPYYSHPIPISLGIRKWE